MGKCLLPKNKRKLKCFSPKRETIFLSSCVGKHRQQPLPLPLPPKKETQNPIRSVLNPQEKNGKNQNNRFPRWASREEKNTPQKIQEKVEKTNINSVLPPPEICQCATSSNPVFFWGGGSGKRTKKGDLFCQIPVYGKNREVGEEEKRIPPLIDF